MNNQQNDEQLWQIAKRRASFKRSLSSYFVINCFLVAVWYFTSGINSHFWPIWPMLGWGLAIAIQYFNAYHGNKISSVQDEYEKLKRQQQSQ